MTSGWLDIMSKLINIADVGFVIDHLVIRGVKLTETEIDI